MSIGKATTGLCMVIAGLVVGALLLGADRAEPGSPEDVYELESRPCANGHSLGESMRRAGYIDPIAMGSGEVSWQHREDGLRIATVSADGHGANAATEDLLQAIGCGQR